MHSEIYQDINKIESLNIRITLLTKYLSYDFLRCIHLMKINLDNKKDNNQIVLSLQFHDLITQKLDHLYLFNKKLIFELLDLFKSEQTLNTGHVNIFPEIFELNKQLLTLCFEEYHDAVKEINKNIKSIIKDTSLASITDNVMKYNEFFNIEYQESLKLSEQLKESTSSYLNSGENLNTIKKERLKSISSYFTMESERKLLNKLIGSEEVLEDNDPNHIELF